MKYVPTSSLVHNLDAFGCPAVPPVRRGWDALGRPASVATTRDGLAWDASLFSHDPATGLRLAKTYADGAAVTEFCDYGRRWYWPAYGRWISRDPIEEEGGRQSEVEDGACSGVPVRGSVRQRGRKKRRKREKKFLGKSHVDSSGAGVLGFALPVPKENAP